ncbi:pyrroline-5-carboxylate reductase [Caulobacter sp. S45]|uniref:pyrroline-5-carboxylate reductase n=1 Tax=Caulobacter sp. S45 TaxID=1641861 RepID=UPI001574FE56|nr:pyrroline-5-carboxylate reductase [Caulobacter sp. S45]
MTPILTVGAGRMGGATARGWLKAGAFAAADLAFRDPQPGLDAQAAVAKGALADPVDLTPFPTLLFAVKPQVWRAIAADLAHRLHPDAVVVSVVAGVRLAALKAAFQGRRVVRVMPTTGVAAAQGVASVYAEDADARARAHTLFDPIAVTVDLNEEGLMDAATAVSGSAPAYLYAFVEALEAAGAKAGLPPDESRALARATIASAAGLMQQTGEEPAELRRQVTSPGGVTQAALEVLMAPDTGFPHLLDQAVDAAIRRSRELGD